MSDFFDNDAITKAWDSGVTRRILAYIKPWKALLAATALTLVLATAGELVTPIVVREVVDTALMPTWRLATTAIVSAPETQGIVIAGKATRIGEKLALPSGILSGLTQAQRKELERRGILLPGEWYLADLEAAGKKGRALVAEKPGLFTVDGDRALIATSALRALPEDEALALRGRDLATVRRDVFLLVIVLVVVLGATFIQTTTSALIGQRVMKQLRMELFRHVTSRSLAFLSRQPVGRLVTRMTNDVETINQFFTDVIVAFLKDSSLMAGVLVVLLAMDFRLALAALVTLPPIAVATVVSRRRARDAFRRQRQWLSRVNAYIAERIAGIAVVQLFAGEARARSEFEAQDRELLKASLGEMYVYATFRPLVDLFASITIATVLWLGSRLVGSDSLSLGTLIAFVNLVRMFYSPVMDISDKYTILQSAMAGGERVFALLDETESIPDRATLPMPARIDGRIELDHVWFGYREGEWVLKDLSLVVEPGEMVAIVGPTGAGKTTIASLVTRLWDVQRGSIRIDGRDVRDLPLGGLRRAIQPVLQEVFLFTGSVEENIRLGEEVTRERMEAAARAVRADAFVAELPEAYATQLSEGGANLSQGQRQLLSFARVLAHDPAVVILDEATSSIDTETERMVQDGLEALLSGRTSIVIAHRLSTIRHADRIVVLAEGKVAETGSHEELLAKRGIYWNLYRLQFGGGLGEVA
ncbi:MAG TPA: ABC transporter ATP-binding protein [Rectinemataceae bacterium]|nr:ABC transporter ATP-binding protein [Rectinemataceae bacterium]